eukprot:364687-Chlamydomonas_euryale.AAC.5
MQRSNGHYAVKTRPQRVCATASLSPGNSPRDDQSLLRPGHGKCQRNRSAAAARKPFSTPFCCPTYLTLVSQACQQARP